MLVKWLGASLDGDHAQRPLLPVGTTLDGRLAAGASTRRLLPDGRIAYSLKKLWKDGTSHVVLSKQVIIERLLALVPRPRRHLVTYHGVLAPAASLRSRVVPQVTGEEENAAGGQGDAANGDSQAPEQLPKMVSANARRARIPHRPAKRRGDGRRYYTWAELLRRVYAIDILKCPRCLGPRRLLAAIQDPLSIEKVLRAMKLLPFHAPELAPARAPPQKMRHGGVREALASGVNLVRVVEQAVR